MINKIIHTTIIILIIGLVFHLCVVSKIIPYTIAWGGRLQNDTEMYVFEAISMIIQLFLIFILLMKGNKINYKFSNKVINCILWIYSILFLLNTVGNIFAVTTLEKFFALITIVLSILIIMILIFEKKNKTIA